MVDTGAARTVFTRTAFPRGRYTGKRTAGLRNITGDPIERFGHKQTTVMLPSGCRAELNGEVTNSSLNALSVRATSMS